MTTTNTVAVMQWTVGYVLLPERPAAIPPARAFQLRFPQGARRRRVRGREQDHVALGDGDDPRDMINPIDLGP